MNKKIILSFLFLIFGISSLSFAAGNNFSALDMTEFKNKINQENNIIIDIRTPEEIALGKITKDALEIDYYNLNFKDELNKLDKDKTYLIYCRTGHRSGDAKKIMKDLGFKSVYDLEGGISAWKDDLFGGPNKEKALADLEAKPTVILIAGTFCPHCQEDVPEVEEKIFNKVKSQINLILNVVDGQDGKRFETNIEQKFDSALDYKVLTGEECGYVPSWVILDKNKKVVNKSCGNQQGTAGIIKTLKELKVDFDKDLSNNKAEKIDNSDKNQSNDYLIYVLILILIGAGAYWSFKK